MSRSVAIVAHWFLLATFVAGGLVAPLVHRVAHASEQEVAVAHDTSDHHHDGASSEHGPEAQPTCPEAVDFDWACTLCHGPTGQACELESFRASLALVAATPFGNVLPMRGQQAFAASARGPPQA